jgi:molybdopterin/thiamine biosynthesis adenylyltransferase
MQKQWDQTKLEKASVAIVGAGELGFFTALPLTCMGIGEIVLYDPALVTEETYPLLGKKGEHLSGAIAEYLCKVNDLVRVQGKSIRIGNNSMPNLAPYPVLIDCSNNQKTTDLLSEYVRKNNEAATKEEDKKALISLRQSIGGGELCASPNKATARPSDAKDPASAMLLGGMAAGEIRKLFNPMSEHETVLDVVVQYDQYHDKRFYTGPRTPSKPLGAFDPSSCNVAVIGAGGTGCFTNLGLAMLGIGNLSIYDNDTVDATNLNRQFLHYDQVEKYKVDSITAKLKPYMKGALDEKNVRIHGKNVRIEEANIAQEVGKPSYLLDCVDNRQTRAVMSRYSQQTGVPFIKMAVTTSLSEVIVTVPGQTPCLNCYLGLYEELPQRPIHCTEQKEASVVMTNQIAAGIALKEFENLVRGQRPLIGVLRYSSTAPQRLFLDQPSLEECACGYSGPYRGA